MGLILDATETINKTKENNYSETLNSSKLLNDVEDYTTSNTKNNVIRNYTNNVINRNTNESNLATNLSKNLQNVSETNQELNMEISFAGAENLEDIKIEQKNKDIQDYASKLNSFTEDVQKIAYESETKDESEKTTKTGISTDNSSSDKTDQTGSSGQSSSQSSEQKSNQGNEKESFRERFIKFIKHPFKIERLPSLFENTFEYNDTVLNNTQKSTNLSEEENIKINSVLNNTETNDIINNAYDKLIETVKKVNRTVNDETKLITEGKTVQKSTMRINFSGAKNLKDLTISQQNEAKKTVKAVMVVSEVLSMDIDDTTKAVMLDMLGATSNYETTNETTNETTQETTNEQTTEQKNKQTSVQTNTVVNVSSIIISIVLVVILFVIFKKKILNNTKPSKYHPLYFPTPKPKTTNVNENKTINETTKVNENKNINETINETTNSV